MYIAVCLEMMKQKLSRHQIYNQFKDYLKPLRIPIIVMMCGGLIAVPLSLLSPKLFQIFLDDVLIQGKMELFIYIAVGMAAVFLLQVINDAIQLKCANKTRNDFIYTLRNDILTKYFHISYEQYSGHKASSLKIRIIDDVDKVGGFVKEQIVDYWNGIITVAATVILCLLTDWLYLLICLPVIPLMLLLDARIANGTRAINEKIRKVNESYGAFEHNTFTMWKEIKIQGAEDSVMNKYTGYRHTLSELGLVYIRYWLYREVFNDFKSNYLTKVLVYIIGAILAIRGTVTVGTIILFGQYYEIMFNAVNSINQCRVTFSSNQPYYSRVSETLDWTEEGDERKEHPVELFPLVFDHVSFSYDGTHEVLKDVSFCIDSGDKIAMSGISGVGKSTIIGLAAGILKPQSGSISYGGILIENINKEMLYRNIGVVNQDSYLFNMTIKENLMIYDTTAYDEDLRTACRMADIEQFIDELPNGYDTVIGEGGIKLSGGQRQRLLIARALTKCPEIIFLDEATSALDEQTENNIVTNLMGTCITPTVVAVSHKPSMQQKFPRMLIVNHQQVYQKINQEASNE